MRKNQRGKKKQTRGYGANRPAAIKKDYSDQILRALDRSGSRGASAKYLQEQMGIRRREVSAFLLALAKLVQAGQVRQKKDRYYKAGPDNTVEAVIVKVTEGFGFARPDGGEEDVFLPGRYLMGALPGDRVRITSRKGRGELPEGQVLKILEEADYRFIGVFRMEKGLPVVYPDGQMKGPVPVDKNGTSHAREGDKVLACIIKRGQRHYDHRAGILMVFGSSQLASVCCQAVLAEHGISTEFPPEVLEEAKKTGSRTITDEEMKGRLDLREECIFTIDGADTKDIDDAISLKTLDDGWELGVHIADVSHYVKARSPLDEEAFARGTSVYYADRVIPMLPKELSNGICSLNPQEDRLAFSARLKLDKNGSLVEYQFFKSVIRSRVKGVYSEVNRLLAGEEDPALEEKYRGLKPTLLAMRELAAVLAGSRSARGGLQLESAEAKIVVGPDGRVADILPRGRGESEGMIEEFMLVANEAAASFGIQRGLPFLFRVHEDPPAEKLEHLKEVLDALGIDAADIQPGVQPGQLQKVLEAARGTENQMLVNSQLLRSMAKAKYREVNGGHFGLVLKKYTHFTSPIRRYPDLAIHRIMTEALAGMDSTEAASRFGKFCQDAAVQSSNTEQRAMTVERSCEDCYKAEYMQGRLGEVFDGVVSGVMERGVFVELPNTVEGMIRTAELPGEYLYDGKFQLQDTVSGRRFRIGDKVRVKAARADVSAGEIDFVLED